MPFDVTRFDIEDRKGLEIVILTALLTFQDVSDAYHEHIPATTTALTSATTTPPRQTSASGAPPPPPKPAPKKGIDRISELQQGRGQVNEVTIFEEGSVTDYAKYCVRLLQVSI